METKTQTQIEKKSYKEFEKDFIEFEQAKKKFIDKHQAVICGVNLQQDNASGRHRTVISLVFDGAKQEEFYDMKN